MVPRCPCKPESLTEEYILAASRLSCKIQGVLGEMWREACNRGTRLRFTVASGSMKPLIQIGDVLMVSKVRPHQIHIGDIVAFQNAQNVVVHRIIGKSLSNQQLTFRHMGDAGASSGKIAAQNIIGRVTVINGWFTTCGPCIKKIPLLNKLMTEYPNVNFIAVNPLDTAPEIKSFLSNNNFTFNHYLTDQQTAISNGVKGMPYVVIVDEKQKIIYRGIGNIKKIKNILEKYIN